MYGTYFAIFMKHLFYCSSIYFLHAQQVTAINIVSIDGLPLNDVSVYENNQLLGVTDIRGVMILPINEIKQVGLIKAGFQEKIVDVIDLNEDIVLYEIGMRNLNAIEITNLDAASELGQLVAKTKNAILYKHKSDNAVYNNFISGKDTLHYLNNKVYRIPYKGLHIENKKKVMQNFKSHSLKDSSSNMTRTSTTYKLGDSEMELSTRFTNRSLNMSWLEPFIDLNKNLKDFNFCFSKKGDTIKVDFEPKKESENLRYSGHVIYNQKDCGIFEMEFTCFGFRLYNTYINGSKKKLVLETLTNI